MGPGFAQLLSAGSWLQALTFAPAAITGDVLQVPLCWGDEELPETAAGGGTSVCTRGPMVLQRPHTGHVLPGCRASPLCAAACPWALRRASLGLQVSNSLSTHHRGRSQRKHGSS